MPELPELLLNNFESLEDQVFALTTLVNSLVLSLHKQNIPVLDDIQRSMCQAANQMEFDLKMPGTAKAVDEMRSFVAALCNEEASLSGKHP